MNVQKGFFASLFDLSFSNLITTRVLKFLYVIAMIGSAIVTVVYIGAAFSASTGFGVLVLLLCPIPFLLYVILARIWIEFILVVFRMADDVREIAARK